MDKKMITDHQQDGVLNDTMIRKICSLAKALDGRPDSPVESYMKSVCAGVGGRPWVHVALAYDDTELVGYKLGRSDDPRCFES